MIKVDYFQRKAYIELAYFLWSRDKIDDCEVVSIRKGIKSVMKRTLLIGNNVSFIRFNEAISILNKIQDNSNPFSEVVSSRKPFGIDTKPQILRIKRSEES